MKTSKAATTRQTNDKREVLARGGAADITADADDEDEQPKSASAIAGQICNALSCYESLYLKEALSLDVSNVPKETAEAAFAEHTVRLEAEKAAPTNRKKSTRTNARGGGERHFSIPLGDASHTEEADGGNQYRPFASLKPHPRGRKAGETPIDAGKRMVRDYPARE